MLIFFYHLLGKWWIEHLGAANCPLKPGFTHTGSHCIWTYFTQTKLLVHIWYIWSFFLNFSRHRIIWLWKDYLLLLKCLKMKKILKNWNHLTYPKLTKIIMLEMLPDTSKIDQCLQYCIITFLFIIICVYISISLNIDTQYLLLEFLKSFSVFGLFFYYIYGVWTMHIRSRYSVLAGKCEVHFQFYFYPHF